MIFILLYWNQLQNYISRLHVVGCVVCLPAMSSNKEVTDRLEYLEKTLEKTITDSKKLSNNLKSTLKTTIDELTEWRCFWSWNSNEWSKPVLSRKNNIEISQKTSYKKTWRNMLSKYFIPLILQLIRMEWWRFTALVKFSLIKIVMWSLDCLIAKMRNVLEFRKKKTCKMPNRIHRKLFITENLCSTQKSFQPII